MQIGAVLYIELRQYVHSPHWHFQLTSTLVKVSLHTHIAVHDVHTKVNGHFCKLGMDHFEYEGHLK